MGFESSAQLRGGERVHTPGRCHNPDRITNKQATCREAFYIAGNIDFVFLKNVPTGFSVLWPDGRSMNRGGYFSKHGLQELPFWKGRLEWSEANGVLYWERSRNLL